MRCRYIIDVIMYAQCCHIKVISKRVFYTLLKNRQPNRRHNHCFKNLPKTFHRNCQDAIGKYRTDIVILVICCCFLLQYRGVQRLPVEGVTTVLGVKKNSKGFHETRGWLETWWGGGVCYTTRGMR